MTDSRPPVDTGTNRLKVLDLGTVIAGPFAATTLADFGAEVIKVERPDGGDTLRRSRSGTPGMANQWLVEGRNKRSITLNLRRPEAQAIVKRLAQWADVLIENFQPGTMAAWNLSYEDLKGINPRLVYVSISGFGQSGPLSGKPGFDQAAIAYSGLTYVTGYSDRPPTFPGFPIGDYFCGAFAALGALEALRRRDSDTGKGEWVDCALYAPLLRASADIVTQYASEGRVREREGGVPGDAPKPEDVTWGYVYQTADGKWISLTALPDFMFPRLTRLLGRPDLLANEELHTQIGRRRNVHLIDEAIRTWVSGHDQKDVLDGLAAHELPHSTVNSISDLFDDPHPWERGDIISVRGVDGVPVTMQGVVPRFVNRPGQVRWAGEPLGASNDAVYGRLLSMEASELAALKADGVI